MDLAFLAMLGGDSWWSWIIWIVFMMVFFMFYPRIMTSQIMWKLEKSARMLEEMSDDSKKFLIKEISSSPTKVIKDSVNRFFEFFVIGPVSLDPAGIVGKLEHVIREQEDRFEYFVDQVAPKFDKESKANLQMGMAGGITLNQIAKIVRHYVELVRETKSVQIAMLLQMQLPMIEKIAKAVSKGTRAMAKGFPIGDGLGPLAAASLMGTKKATEVEKNIVMVKTKMEGRNLFVIKAKGPGGRLGRPGKGVEKIVNRNRIDRIISIDAAAKLYGEKTGSLAEGVGVAMGGPGVERFYIEQIAVKKKIPLDSIIVKMSQEEAITPMRKAVKDALPEVRESLKRSLKRTKKNDNVLVVGVGNTSGVGNSAKVVKEVGAWVDKAEKHFKLAHKKRKKRLKFF